MVRYVDRRRDTLIVVTCCCTCHEILTYKVMPFKTKPEDAGKIVVRVELALELSLSMVQSVGQYMI